MAAAINVSYRLRKGQRGGGGDGCIDGQCGRDFNRCLLAKYYEKTNLNTNPIAMTMCS